MSQSIVQFGKQNDNYGDDEDSPFAKVSLREMQLIQSSTKIGMQNCALKTENEYLKKEVQNLGSRANNEQKLQVENVQLKTENKYLAEKNQAQADKISQFEAAANYGSINLFGYSFSAGKQ